MRARQTCPGLHPRPLPRLWLLTDKRNDAALEQTIERLPRGSGIVFRHYHLPPAERRARFAEVARIARVRDHVVCLAGSPRLARAWGADGFYGPPHRARRAANLLRLATAHSLRELGAARRAVAHVVLLSPVFATRSHPDAAPLGVVRFRLLARQSAVPVIALGGMNPRTAAHLQWGRWGAIDGRATRSRR
ncbi:MAG: thiamine phosphate synthase [Croceibacterium sp.]